MPVNHHTGSSAPPMGPEPEDAVVFLLETSWWSHRALTAPHGRRRVRAPPRPAGGVHRAGHRPGCPRSCPSSTTSGTAWATPSGPRSTSGAHRWCRRCRSSRASTGPASATSGPASSVPPRSGCAHSVGVDRIMWGSDYPHKEASTPYSPEAIRLAFTGVPHDEVQAMVGGQRGGALRLRPRGAAAARPAHRPARGRGRRAARPRPRAPRRRHVPGLHRLRVRHRLTRRRDYDRDRWGRSATGLARPSSCATGSWRPPRPRRGRRCSRPSTRPTRRWWPPCCRRRSRRPTSALVKVTIATVDMGRGIPVFGAGTFAVRARHGDEVGYYPLVMPMTTEQAVVGGRETFGEPKKLGEVTLERDGDRVRGRLHPHGRHLRRGRSARSPASWPLPPEDHRVDFYLKFLLDPGGQGVRRRSVARPLPP